MSDLPMTPDEITYRVVTYVAENNDVIMAANTNNLDRVGRHIVEAMLARRRFQLFVNGVCEFDWSPIK